ncbi:DUF1349 domain-containing protein [Occallatibacter savannae]|uniref:DUF1349 domain-containing protein n=1 Tax=Occallatibacter savannae TaxID=1002691 RepID=UPI000D69E281|nr:DUF1349 domain-containing protein [Occallatibacter savannae]
MQITRRHLLHRSALAAGALCLPNLPAIAIEPQSQPTPPAGDDLFSRMTWFNPPASSKINGGELIVRSKPKTDFWQKTYDGYAADTGHFFHLPASGDFKFTALCNGNFATQYDQNGLMVRIDADNWMRCGTEFIDGKRSASVVFTRTYSDGSTLPDLSQTAPVWWRLVRKNDSIETFCSLDGEKYLSVRMGYFPKQNPVQVGVMCCAPTGGKDFDSTFTHLKLE